MKIRKFTTPILSVVTIIYTVWYMRYDVPYKNSGALSKIGLTHHTEFVIWGALTLLTLGVGIILAYSRYLKTRVYIPLLLVSAIGMVLTLCFDFRYGVNPDYYLHCTGSLLFSAVTGVNIFVFYLLNYNDKLFRAFMYIAGGILIVDLVLLLIFKETGLIEVVPIFAGYIMLSITNLRRDRVEATR